MPTTKELFTHKNKSKEVQKYEWQINSKYESAKLSIIVPRHSQMHIYAEAFEFQILYIEKCKHTKIRI